jgi:outer membrane protein assembly factor BamB
MLSCKSCQHDLSGCSGGICGYSIGLESTAWAAEGGCMKRPNQSRLLGPAGTSGTFHAPVGVASAFSPQLVVNDQGNLIFQGGTSLYRWSGTLLLTTKNTPHAGAATLVVRSNGTALRVTDQSISSILNPNGTNPDLNTSTNNQGGGPLTTNVVLVENIAYYARADGKLLRTSLGLGNLLPTEVHHTSPAGLRGSIAHDPKENRLYVHQDCSKVGALPCKLLAINRNSGSKAWEADVGPATSAPCHAAVGAGGIVYATCGDQARFFLPQNPTQLTASFSAGAGRLALAPALRADGTVYLLFDGDNPVLLATTPQLQVLWSRSLEAPPLGAPLLDAAGNAYLCLQDRVVSFDPEGEARWTYPFASESNTGCAMAISSAGQLDVVTSTGAYRIKGP